MNMHYLSFVYSPVEYIPALGTLLIKPCSHFPIKKSLFSRFDELAGIHKVQKVETAGDCYIVADGILSFDDQGFTEVCIALARG